MGLPACESGNPLLTPLAGHELGHTTWQAMSLSGKYSPLLEDAIYKNIEDRWEEYRELLNCPRDQLRGNLFVGKAVSAYHYFSLKQAEETFCDLLGVRIFSESYLHAFAYLVAPGDAVVRLDEYPKTKTRIATMVAAARKYEVPIPVDYEANYSDQIDSPRHDHKLMMSLADHAVSQVVGGLVEEADAIVRNAGLPARAEPLIQHCLKSYKLLVPASDAGSLANILNAGWRAHNDGDLWGDNEEVKINRKQILFDIILKSIEVLEFESITEGLA